MPSLAFLCNNRLVCFVSDFARVHVSVPNRNTDSTVDGNGRVVIFLRRSDVQGPKNVLKGSYTWKRLKNINEPEKKGLFLNMRKVASNIWTLN